MIQNYLDANLITITDDSDVKKLKKSADQIVKNLAKNKNKIVSYTLSAIDPSTPVNNTDIIEVKDIIIKNWPTFTGNAKDTPVTYIRAVILEALANLSEDRSYAILIWLASRNVLKYFKLIGNEKELIHSFIKKLGNEVNKLATEEWALGGNNTLHESDLKLKEIVRYAINEDLLIKYLEDAVGPTNKAGKANYESPNPSWPDDGSEWSHAFPTRAAKGIKNTVDACLKAIVTVVNENKDLIESDLLSKVDRIQQQTVDSNKSLVLRSEILWWKEAAYSASTDKSYQEIHQELLSFILAFDYSSIIPVFFPKSVDYFLAGTYKSLYNKAAEEKKIEEFLERFAIHSEELKLIWSEHNLQSGKITMAEFIIGLVNKNYTMKDFEKSVGIAADTKISALEFTIWLFHDFQLFKAVNIK